LQERPWQEVRIPSRLWIFFKFALAKVERAIKDKYGRTYTYGLGLPSAEEEAEGGILTALANGELVAEGIDAGREPPEYVRVPEAWWAGARISRGDPTNDRWTGPVGRTVINRYSCVLRRRINPDAMIEWRWIRVRTEELDALLLRLYPNLAIGEAKKVHTDDLRTGFAGRPSARSLIAAEMERRANSGELKPSARAEAKELADWYAASYPEGPSTSHGTIRNSLADLYKRLNSQVAPPPGQGLGGTKCGTKLS
jgi:hypothetical protein